MVYLFGVCEVMIGDLSPAGWAISTNHWLPPCCFVTVITVFGVRGNDAVGITAMIGWAAETVLANKGRPMREPRWLLQETNRLFSLPAEQDQEGL